MTTKQAITGLLCGAASAIIPGNAAMAQDAATRPAQPNIVFILADDLGWTSLGSYGGALVSTPNIDRLAAEGMKFTRAYVTPQCTPSRACLLTGQYSARNRMWHVVGSYYYPYMRLREPAHLEGLPRDIYTLPKALRDSGYQTGIVGKWHLHNWTDGGYDALFEQFSDVHGFDSSFPLYGGLNRSSGGSPDKGVDLHTEAAVRFITEARQPYYLHIGYHPVHGPANAPHELVQKYVDKGFSPDRKALNSAPYLAMLENLDNAVGRIGKAIDASGQRDNTIVVFLSDNGGVSSAYSNAPLRQGKGSAYEGGVRVPMIVRWPGSVAPGSVCDLPVHAVDIYPTFAEVASARTSPQHHLDGVSLVPLLRGKPWQRGEPVYFFQPLYDAAWSATPSASIIDGDYKLIDFFGDYVDVEDNKRYIPAGRIELYNLKTDIGETHNLADQMPGKARELQQRLYRWLEKTQAPLPTYNPGYNPDKLWERSGGQWFAPVAPKRTRSQKPAAEPKEPAGRD